MTLERDMSLCYATVLDDVVNQLFVLGKVLPHKGEDEEDAAAAVDREISEVVRAQRSTEEKLEAVLAARATQIRERALAQELTDLMSLKMRGSEQSAKESPLSRGNYAKMERERSWCEEVMFGLQQQLLEECDFAYLSHVTGQQRHEKLLLQQQIVKEEQSRQRIRQLQRRIAGVKREREAEVQQCNEQIAHLNDQLQEMKAKSAMESKYVRKHVDNQVAQNTKRCDIAEQRRAEELEALKRRIDSEERSHQEICNFLNKQQSQLEEKIEHWMERYDADVGAKKHELKVLKASKQSDAERMSDLVRRYGEYEKTVVHDRIEKEKIRRRERRDDLELQSALRLQAWWRASLVQRKLGPFSPNRKKKKKGGGGGGKKKKKGGKKK